MDGFCGSGSVSWGLESAGFQVGAAAWAGLQVTLAAACSSGPGLASHGDRSLLPWRPPVQTRLGIDCGERPYASYVQNFPHAGGSYKCMTLNEARRGRGGAFWVGAACLGCCRASLPERLPII